MGAVGEPVLAEQFKDLSQQRATATLGMWVFLATEVMFFGALFTAYTVNRFLYGEGFRLGWRHMERTIGTINTAILLTSSLAAALAVQAAKAERRARLLVLALCVALLGIVFDGLKLYEYATHIKEGLLPGVHFEVEGGSAPGTEIFFILYYLMTGVHAIHVLIGVGVFLVLAVMTARGHFSRGRYEPVEVSALYWHFVDIVWLFLYPLFYLIG